MMIVFVSGSQHVLTLVGLVNTCQQRSAKVSKSQQSSAKPTDNVYDNVNDNEFYKKRKIEKENFDCDDRDVNLSDRGCSSNSGVFCIINTFISFVQILWSRRPRHIVSLQNKY